MSYCVLCQNYAKIICSTCFCVPIIYFPDLVRLSCLHYRLPFARLWVLHNISQFFDEVAPPLLHADTWSASISPKLQILLLLASCRTAQCEQFDFFLVSASRVCFS